MGTFEEDVVDDLDTLIEDLGKDFVFSRTGLTIKCLFDNAFVVVVDDVETTSPAIPVVKDSDVPDIVHGDTFTRVTTGIVYKTIGIHPDGTGSTEILLSQD